MLKHSIPSPRRTGFTLVEMLVAAAVSILLMVIITTAFTAGLDMFRKLRAQGKLQDAVRQAGTTIKDDLSWNHFQMKDSSGYADDVSFVRGQDLTNDKDWQPPPDGFFRIVNGIEPNGGGNPFVFDGTDRDQYPFTRATTHALHFTVQRPASGPDQMFRTLDMLRGPPFVTPQPPNPNPPNLFFPFWPNPNDPNPGLHGFVDPIDYREAQIPNPVYPPFNAPFATRWAEVAYYLVANGDSVNNVQLFNLYRAQKLLMPLPNGGQPGSLGGGPSTAKVTVGSNGNGYAGPQPQGTPYNPEMSRRYVATPPQNANAADPRRFNPVAPNLPPVTYVNPPPPNPPQQDSEAYNRTTDVTQPRFRFGMLPASNRMPSPTPAPPPPSPPPVPPSVHSRNFHNAAGLTQIATPNWSPGQPYKWRYPVMADNPGFGVGTNDPGANNDLLLTNVISFEIKAYWSGNPTPNRFYQVPDANAVGGFITIPNADFPFDYIPLSQTNLALATRGLRVFDTWSNAAGSPYTFAQVINGETFPEMWKRTDSAGVTFPDDTAARLPLRIRVRAIQIRIRIWDPKSEQTRQVTIIQDV